jgi:deazaflavin-dependent oxidoreductase (nitroreductase family)
LSESNSPPALPGWIKQHIELYLADPEKGHMWDSGVAGGPGPLPTLLLTTVGRNSGAQRLLPLIYKKVAGNYVIIASKGGAPKHPAWYLNLVGNPNCDVQVGPEKMTAIARTAQGEERSDLWAQLAEVYPPYNDYQVAAGNREIPVIVLEPTT